MESALKRMLKHHSSLPVLPTVVISALMVALLALGAATDPAAAKKAPTGGTLHGTTSQGLPGYVKTSYGGVLIAKSSIPIEVKCSSGSFLLPQTFKMVPISPGGRFKETAEGSTLDEEGVSVRIFESFSGKFNRQRTNVVTKSRIYATVHAPDGSVEKCDSGVVTMHAHK